MSAGWLGYALAGSATGHRAASTIIYMLLAFAFGVVLDLDRPGTGGINVSQDPFERATRAIIEGAALSQST